jgi:hypothetical protein
LEEGSARNWSQFLSKRQVSIFYKANDGKWKHVVMFFVASPDEEDGVLLKNACYKTIVL